MQERGEGESEGKGRGGGRGEREGGRGRGDTSVSMDEGKLLANSGGGQFYSTHVQRHGGGINQLNASS